MPTNPIKKLFAKKIDMGLISIWYGPKKQIPAGYAECNGENGTPDLRQSSAQLGLTYVMKVK